MSTSIFPFPATSLTRLTPLSIPIGSVAVRVLQRFSCASGPLLVRRDTKTSWNVLPLIRFSSLPHFRVFFEVSLDWEIFCWMPISSQGKSAICGRPIKRYKDFCFTGCQGRRESPSLGSSHCAYPLISAQEELALPCFFIV